MNNQVLRMTPSIADHPVRTVAEQPNSTAHASALPFVSIIMPVRNEERHITNVLQSLLGQDYPHDRMEIIVADGMSSDATRQMVSAIRDDRVHLLENHRRIMSAGFNLGLKAARGEIIVMMGGHTEIAADYLKASVSLLQKGDVDCVGGPIRTVGETDVATAISLAMSSRFGVGGTAFRVGCREPKCVDTVAFGVYTRKIMERAGPLDEEFVRGQDDEFNYRLRKLGGKILLAPELRSRYTSRSSFHSLWWQYFGYGYWKVRILQKHPRQMQLRQFVPAGFVLALLVSFVMAAVRPALGGLMLFALCGAYLFATAFISVSLAARNHWKLAPLLALTFPVLHFSYGIGFLAGLIRFCNRWWRSEGPVLVEGGPLTSRS
jgi:glycosyltransferase involved in cell wall biosynthesis